MLRSLSSSPAKIMALLMASESFIAAILYLVQGDVRHACYWASSACIILSVTL
jgi:hypothetical protein